MYFVYDGDTLVSVHTSKRAATRKANRLGGFSAGYFVSW